MKELKYIEKIRREDSLLSLPQSLSEILAMVGQEDFSVDELTDLILKDPGLTSKILKMANSAFYRHRSQISTVQQAVMMLGIMQVKCLVLSASIFRIDSLQKKCHVDIKGLFGHFLSVALGCKMISELTGYEATDEAFIAGLLHDMGIVYFVHHFMDDYGEVIDSLSKYRNLIDAEKDILGIDHAAIGQILAEKWNFPKELCQAIGDHHKVPDKVAQISLINIVQLSELINKPVVDIRPGNLEARLMAVNQMSRLMKIDRQKLDEITFSLLNETLNMAEYMGVDIGDPTDILARANKELYNSYLTIENLFRERQELSHRIISEERRTATLETKNVAIATLSHYLNNATMSISGRAQLIRMLTQNGSIVDNENRLETIIEVMEQSVKKILAVLYELRDLTDFESMEKYSESKAINIDDRIKERLVEMEKGADEILAAPDRH
jgi:HD-like signal output (HDOD) protein